MDDLVALLLSQLHGIVPTSFVKEDLGLFLLFFNNSENEESVQQGLLTVLVDSTVPL